MALLVDQSASKGLAQDIVLGVALANMLLVCTLCIHRLGAYKGSSDCSASCKGMGLAMFFAGLARQNSFMSTQIVTDMSKLAWISLSPLVFTWAHGLAAATSSTKSLDKPYAKRATSGAGAIALLLIFGFWLYYKRTHRAVWMESLSVTADYRVEEADESLMVEKFQVTKLTQSTHCVIAVSGLIAMVSVTRFVIASVEPLAISSSLSIHFFGFIVVPIATTCPNYLKAMDFAYHGRKLMPSVCVTFGAAIGTITFSLPLLLLISWGRNFSLYMDTPLLHLAPLVLSAWLTSYLMHPAVHWLSGLICISL